MIIKAIASYSKNGAGDSLVTMNNDFWDITKKPHKKRKIEILRKVFNMWLTVWNGKKQQQWVNKEWYIIDLFAGIGEYKYKNKKLSGSPLIFLEEILEQSKKLYKNDIKIKLFLVEKDEETFKVLNKKIEDFLTDHSQLNQVVEIVLFNEDCNLILKDLVKQIKENRNNPLFVLIDPPGLQIKNSSMKIIIGLKNIKDILFNYILEGVRRTGGVAKKKNRGEELNVKEIKTIETLYEFIGQDIDLLKKRNDIEVLKAYVNSIFIARNLKVVGYDMKYSERNDTIYYLLFASGNPKITNIVKDIYAKQKEKTEGPTLFGGKEYYKELIFSEGSNIGAITRKSLLYKSKVEYGSWTINHIQGCLHGCKFPCYAMMMAKKFGWVRNYEEWQSPKIVINALELLDKELLRYRDDIDFVHLCFMSDPFMYNIKKNALSPEVKQLTLKIIEKINAEDIKVTVLTKGFYPEEIFDPKYSHENEYGITLVSLNPKFKQEFEPFSAPYNKRIKSLKTLHEKDYKTWVSIEPYPTPNIDNSAKNIESLLSKISFTDKIIFGKMNYNVRASKYEENADFYKRIAEKVVVFCSKHGIKHHIKFGTPYSKENTKNIFK